MENASTDRDLPPARYIKRSSRSCLIAFLVPASMILFLFVSLSHLGNSAGRGWGELGYLLKTLIFGPIWAFAALAVSAFFLIRSWKNARKAMTFPEYQKAGKIRAILSMTGLIVVALALLTIIAAFLGPFRL